MPVQWERYCCRHCWRCILPGCWLLWWPHDWLLQRCGKPSVRHFPFLVWLPVSKLWWAIRKKYPVQYSICFMMNYCINNYSTVLIYYSTKEKWGVALRVVVTVKRSVLSFERWCWIYHHGYQPVHILKKWRAYLPTYLNSCQFTFLFHHPFFIPHDRYYRVSGKIPFMLLCEIHRRRLRRHNCCPCCGLFCTQVSHLYYRPHELYC